MSSFTLRKIGIQYTQYFAPPGEAPASVSPEEQMKRDAIKAFPDLAKLAEQVSPMELYNRAKVMSKLKDMADNPEKTFGKLKSGANSVGVGRAVDNLRVVLDLLKSNPKIQEIADTNISAWFKGWDGPGDTNVAVVSGTNMSIRMFLGNVLNDSQLVAQLLSVPEKAPESKESEVVRQRTRFGTFLLALETRYPSSDYKLVFRLAHEALGKGDIDTAKELVRKPLKDDWNIDVNSIIDSQGHINALRAIGATDEAALRTKEQVKGKFEKGGQFSPKESALIADIGTNIEAEKSRKKAQAESKYNAVLAALPAHDPTRIQVERNKDTMIAQFSEDMAYLTIMDGFIKKNGSDGLKQLGEVYDDMRGLYGTLNFTDENAKMTKEMAVMLASFVLTGGAGALIRGLAVAGRAVAGADTLKAVDVASKAGSIRQRATQAGNAGRAIGRGIGNGAVQAAEGAQNIGRIASSTRLGAIPAEALKFTTADALLRTAFRAEGERSGFEDYFEKFGKNLAMFTAFAGMEKFVSGPLKEKLLGALAQKGVQLNPASTFAVGSTILTGGDVAAMWGLGMAEKGEFHMPEWKEVFQALAFRIGMKGAEKAFPKIAESIQVQADKRRSSQKKGSAPEVAKIEGSPKLSDSELLAQGLRNEIAAAKRGDINITPEALAFKEAQLAKLESSIQAKNNKKPEAGGGSPEAAKGDKAQKLSDDELLAQGLRNEIAAAKRKDINITPEALAFKEAQLAQLEAKLLLKHNPKIEALKIGEQVRFDTQYSQYTFEKVKDGYKLISTSNPKFENSVGEVFTNISIVGNKLALMKGEKIEIETSKIKGEPVYIKGPLPKLNDEIKYLSDFSSLQLGQKVRVEYQGNIVEGTVARISPNKDSIGIQIGDNTRLDGPVGRVKILQDAPLQTAVGKTEGSGVDAKQKLGLTQTKEFNHANLNERADFRKTLDTATRGDSVQIGESIYRRVNNGWQKFDAGTPLAQRDYTQGTFRTTEQVMADWNLAKKPATFKKAEAQPQPEATQSQEYDVNGRPIDRGAQDRINQEHRIGEPVPSARQSAEAFANGSFRAEMDIIMTIDDAAFQKRFTEAQYRNARGEQPQRSHEVQMYEAAANVRKHSDATIIANAENIIKGNREFLGTRPSGADKAYVVAENAALRSRLKDIVAKKINPVIAQAVEDAATTGKPGPLAAALNNEKNNNRRLWPLLLLLLPLIWALATCAGKGDGNSLPPGSGGGNSLPPSSGGSKPNPDQIAAFCADCATGPRGTINPSRPSEVNPKVILTNEKREKLSEKFMKESVWQDFIKQYDSLKQGLQGSSHPLSQMLMKRIEDVMVVPNVDNVQDLQRCIAMFDPKTPGGNDLDHQKGQDGILGPITTGKILDAISKCGVAKK